MKPFVGLGLLAALALAVAIGLGSAEGVRSIAHVEAVGPEFSTTELWDAADIVAVVVPTGAQTERWNNATNTMWKAADDSGIMPMIFRDEVVSVVTLLKGEAGDVLTVRNIGGVVDGVEFVYDGLFDLKNGARYLVFLENVRTPTQEGFEQAISFVAQGQGIYSAVGGGYQNGVGRTVTLAELKAR